MGRQLDHLTIGILGYGRLGGLMNQYCQAFGSMVLVNDPYKTVNSHERLKQVSLDKMLSKSDVISLHVHVTDETTEMIDAAAFAIMKDDVLIVNTSRGEIVDEKALIEFLRSHPKARYSTDVITAEITDNQENPLKKHAKDNPNQVLITPHIGGMTIEGQSIAYNHALLLLEKHLTA